MPDALVIDDHPLVARGIAGYLSAGCGYAPVELAFDRAQAAACLRRAPAPALVVLDFWLGQRPAVDLLQHVASHHPETRILVLSGDEDARIMLQAQALGAHGFIKKSDRPAVFAEAVQALAQHRSWFPRLACGDGSPAAASPLATHGLTARQAQVLGMMLRGESNKRIAEALCLSEPTVKEHVSAILRRFDVSSRAQVLALFSGQLGQR
ncbi:Transcriptional regulator, LuxR family [plant metagenome]